MTKAHETPAAAAPFLALTRYPSLTLELAKRDIQGRYRGSSFGLGWSLLSPFLLLLIYTFSFGTVMGGRWPQAQSADTSFSIILFAAIIVHSFFAECLTKAPLLVVSNPNFVKRVVFPLEILPWPMVISALFHTLMNTGIFVLLRLLMDGDFSWTIVFLPLVMLPLVVLSLGMAWILASLGVYLRDIAQVTGLASMAFLFLSSALMPVDSVDARYRWVFLANPLTFIIDQARDVMLWGRFPDWQGLAIYLAIATVVMYAGRAWFRATQRGFADVL